MVQFARLSSDRYIRLRALFLKDSAKGGGFPHSEIPGSKEVCSSPGLIAACHVLHRLLMPRHPLCALDNLTVYSVLLDYFLIQPQHPLLQNITLFRKDSLSKICLSGACSLGPNRPHRSFHKSSSRKFMEMAGVEPATSCLQSRRSPN